MVLVLIAISATLVLPSLRSPKSLGLTAGTDGGPTSAVDVLMTEARRLAIKRGEPLHLRVNADGLWAIVPSRGGDAIQSGRITEALAWMPDVTIDAMGVCALSQGVMPMPGTRRWDALACRWQRAGVRA